MDKVNNRFNGLLFALACLAYLCLCGAFYSRYQTWIDPDGISYINIAVKYAHGNWAQAINGFWSPLVSWLMAPFIFAGVNSILASKLVAIILGLVTLNGIRLLTQWFQLGWQTKGVVYLTIVPLLVTYTYSAVPVDLSLLAVLLHYLYFIYHPQLFKQYKYAVLVGMVGCVCYFAKQYAFPFFFLHTTLIVIYRLIREKPFKFLSKSSAKFLAVVYGSFFALALLWMVHISIKYNQGLIYGTTGKINFSQALNHQVRNINEQGFFLYPPNPTATDWTEDVFYLQGKYVHIFDSKETLKQEQNLIMQALRLFVKYMNRMCLLWIPIVIGALIFYFRKNENHIRNRVLLPLITLVLYPSGYLLIWVEERFLWIMPVLLLLLSVYLFEKWMEEIKRHKGVIHLLFLVVLVFSFWRMAVLEFVQTQATNDPTVKMANLLTEKFHLHGLMYGEGYPAEQIQMLSFRAGLQNVIIHPKYYGTSYHLPTQLINGGINYYFLFHQPGDTLKPIPNFSEISQGQIPGLWIYKIQ